MVFSAKIGLNSIQYAVSPIFTDSLVIVTLKVVKKNSGDVNAFFTLMLIDTSGFRAKSSPGLLLEAQLQAQTKPKNFQ